MVEGLPQRNSLYWSALCHIFSLPESPPSLRKKLAAGLILHQTLFGRQDWPKDYRGQLPALRRPPVRQENKTYGIVQVRRYSRLP